MLRDGKLKTHARALTVIAKLQGRLLMLCSLILASSGAWLVTSCAQGNPQDEQTRPRRTQNENAATAGGAQNVNMRNSNNDAATNTGEGQRAKSAPVGFYAALTEALRARGMRMEDVCDRKDAVSQRILEDYGAVFVAAPGVMPPPVCIFQSEADVVKFQNAARFTSAIIGGAHIELQPAAMEALQAAREEARGEGLDITPRGGTEAARRSYQDTVRLWDTRFLPALSYWMKRGRLTKEQVEHLKTLSLTDQVREVLELEKSGIYFSKDFSKSILYSIAAPGTSQHIMMLALDVDQFTDARVREILARHGWFQTVKSDLPHFTYLGLSEAELPARGLRKVKSGSQLFWIPNVSD